MRLLRRYTVCGPQGKLPVGLTKFNDDYVYHEGGPAFIPGTCIPRLRPVRLGPRAIAFVEDEVEAIIESLRRERNDRNGPRPASKSLGRKALETKAPKQGGAR
jgi:hypothetical protein